MSCRDCGRTLRTIWSLRTTLTLTGGMAMGLGRRSFMTASLRPQPTMRKNGVLSKTLSSLRSSRSFLTIAPRRPSLLQPSRNAFGPTPQSSRSADGADIMPKVSSHPALSNPGAQIRCGPRDTYNPHTYRRKRKLGFLARQRCRTGRAILKRRQLKGRKYLTH